MASKSTASSALFLFLNILFFSTVTATYTYPPPPTWTCPIDTLKLGVCADLLGLVHVIIGSPPTKPCCTLIEGLADLEAAVCLCTAIKANLLGVNLNVPLSISVILNACGKHFPTGFTCY
ncbi:hypothetical protein ACHQM5_001289 [Ranunculus cassubicifolius]